MVPGPLERPDLPTVPHYPPGIRPLHPINYALAGTWSPDDSDAVSTGFPFPIRIPWTELRF
ncbi:hypothetical protein AB0H71_12415 [Nocardia sp. NPDC050697]|uniref:hypothetical protein n=1 Tax=Nocardia sp. NPDC050697 TaxID=3155158 RepID=UPI0033DB4CD3